MAYSPTYLTNPCAEIFLNDMRIKEINIIDKNAIVDGEKWYTVVAGDESAKWIREQDTVLWHEATPVFSSSIFDIHNELLFIMKLKWTC